ncbi:MAG: excisionase family DNA-binding protein [Baekduiaceae bacterium]
MTLDRDDVEAIARRVAELVGPATPVVERPLNAKQAAAAAGVSHSTILRAIKAGHLLAYRTPAGRDLSIRPSDLEAWLYASPERAVNDIARDRAPSSSRMRSGSGSVAAIRARER